LKIFHVSHRGLIQKSLKENTLLGFKKSFQKKYSLETDLRYTKDGEIICVHDADLKRIYGKKDKIKSLTVDQLNKKTKNTLKIPTLDDLLRIYKDDVYLFLELKGLFKKDILYKLLEKTSKFKKIVFISFWHKNLYAIHSINKQLLLGASFHRVNSKAILEVNKKLKLFCFILNKELMFNSLFNKFKIYRFYYTVKDRETYLKYKNRKFLIIEHQAIT